MRHHHPLAFIALLALAGCTGGVSSPAALHTTTQRDGTCAPDDKSCATAPADTCTDEVAGDGTCTPYADLKDEATAACATQGGGLTDLHADPQGCPDGSAPSAVYTCCVAPADPDAPTCSGGAVGDGTTCVDEASLHDEASAACSEAGLPLTDFYPSPCADGGVNVAKYVCCSP